MDHPTVSQAINPWLSRPQAIDSPLGGKIQLGGLVVWGPGVKVYMFPLISKMPLTYVCFFLEFPQGGGNISKLLS